MIIGVDAGCLGIEDVNLQVGVFQVAKNLLIELGKSDRDNTYLLYSFYPIDEELLKSFGTNFKNIVVRPAKGWMTIWLPLQLLKDKPAVFLGLSQALPLQIPWATYKKIVIFYDLAFEKYPQFYTGSFKKIQKQSIYAATYADAIVTISQKTKDDLITLYNVPNKKITVTYLGVNRTQERFGKSLKKHYKVDSSLASDNIVVPYFLFIGALKRSKNVPTIIKAFAYFIEKTKRNYNLLLVGGNKWPDPEIDNVFAKLPDTIKHKIQFLGYVDDAALPLLYKQATAFVSPSLYEGFGLPFVEAMHYGCPIIGSIAGAVPEIVGDAGLLYEPKDYKSIGNAMERLSHEKSLYKELITKGNERVKTFTWEKFADDILSMLVENKPF